MSFLTPKEVRDRLTAKDKEGELTPKKLFKVSHRLDKKSDIRALGLQLGIKEHKIDTIFTNKKDDITEAVYEMLKEWRKGQRDRREAYTNLWVALTHPDVNLLSVAHEALESDGDSLVDYTDVRRKRRQREQICREKNGRNTNHYDTPESGICESHPDEGIQRKRLGLEEDEDIIPVKSTFLPALHRVLKDEDLDRIAAVMDKDDIYRLGKQLEISSAEIDKSFTEHYPTPEKHCPTLKKPICKILKKWLKKQRNRHEAYLKLGEALTHPDVGLNLIASEFLKYPPAKQPSRSSASCSESVSREYAQCKGTHGTGVKGAVASC